ncbi:Crp/Fnr family transcriptional regulator [Escherichia coli]|nr:Crp/Fnr family transcriptional regulator [Escherichia coli]
MNARAGLANLEQTPCAACPLRAMAAFRDFTPDELVFITKLKRGELRADKGATILQEGANSAHIYTVLSGWAFRYKLLPDGRRQILNYLLPGDLIGLQSILIGEMAHSVETLTPMVLCMFERADVHKLYRNEPELAYDITWIASREEQILDENLLSVGRRSAIERSAYLIAFLASRARMTGMGTSRKTILPIRQHHMADTLGLSLVHTNRTLRRLAGLGLIVWDDRGCEVLDIDGLAGMAHWEGLSKRARPFI